MHTSGLSPARDFHDGGGSHSPILRRFWWAGCSWWQAWCIARVPSSPDPLKAPGRFFALEHE